MLSVQVVASPGERVQTKDLVPSGGSFVLDFFTDVVFVFLWFGLTHRQLHLVGEGSSPAAAAY